MFFFINYAFNIYRDSFSIRQFQNSGPIFDFKTIRKYSSGPIFDFNRLHLKISPIIINMFQKPSAKCEIGDDKRAFGKPSNHGCDEK